MKCYECGADAQFALRSGPSGADSKYLCRQHHEAWQAKQPERDRADWIQGGCMIAVSVIVIAFIALSTYACSKLL